MMANGNRASVTNLKAHAAYQEALARLLAGMEGQSEKDSIDAAIAFRRSYGLSCPDCDPVLYLVGLHRQRYRSRLVTPELRGYSAKWLHERGFSLELDQVFAPAVKREAE